MTVADEGLAATASYLKSGDFSVELSHESAAEPLAHAVNNVSVDRAASRFHAEIDGKRHSGDFLYLHGRDQEALHLWMEGSHFSVTFPNVDYGNAELEEGGKKSITSPMPGRVVEVFVENGQKVSKGDVILALEAMKMELTIKATKEGIVNGLSLTKDSKVTEGTVLAYLE